MTSNLDSIFKKLDRIPAAPNFARYAHADLSKTLKSYVAFAKGMPTITYAAGITIIRDFVLGLIDGEQALRASRRIPESPSKNAVVDFVSAFCIYGTVRGYRATPAYSDFSTSFAIGRDLFIPVKPTLVAREDGQLKPVFCFGWKSIPLDNYQRRLLMTILEDALFSLDDFRDSDAEIVFLPENEFGIREAEVWHRGDYNLLPDLALREQMDTFLQAREQAYPIIQRWVESKRMTRNLPTATVEPDHNQYAFDI